MTTPTDKLIQVLKTNPSIFQLADDESILAAGIADMAARIKTLEANATSHSPVKATQPIGIAAAKPTDG